jgi:HSP20 family protein
MPEIALERNGKTAAVARPEPEATFTPRVDILETADELLLFVDLPGVTPGDVDIKFENGEMALTGRRPAKRAGRPWLWEYDTGSFNRTFRVTETIAGDKIHAELKDGVLTVHLPKVDAAKPRRIAVKG